MEYELLTLGLHMGEQALHFNFCALWQVILVFRYILNNLEGFKPLQECSLSFRFFCAFFFELVFVGFGFFQHTPTPPPALDLFATKYIGPGILLVCMRKTIPFDHVCSIETGLLCLEALHPSSAFSGIQLCVSDRI